MTATNNDNNGHSNDGHKQPMTATNNNGHKYMFLTRHLLMFLSVDLKRFYSVTFIISIASDSSKLCGTVRLLLRTNEAAIIKIR